MAFNLPPLNLPLEYALDFHLEKNPDHVAITYSSGATKDHKSYTYKELVPAIHRAGQAILADTRSRENFLPTSPVVVILIKTGGQKPCQLTPQTHVLSQIRSRILQLLR
jgi:acyl-coenzyme A synthetase/AMP-(fatty) acid ligase